MRPHANAGLALAAGLAVLGPACSTAEQVFPDTGGALVTLRDSSLGPQAAPSAQRQILTWTLDEASLSVPDLPAPYSFLAAPPCQVTSIPGLDGDLIRSCGGSGLTLEADQPRSISVNLTVEMMTVRRAARPDLGDEGDYDGDGVPNSSDNCRLVPNPEQENVNGGAETADVGDACSALDPSTGEPTIPDQDLDGVRDALDNCVWVRNPVPEGQSAQLDSNSDGIGDACEQEIAVVLPAGGLRLTCATAFTQPASVLARFVIDFGEALECGPTSSVCALRPDDVTMTVSGGAVADPVPCELSPGS